ncbi:MAG: NAD-dependent epimerase [Bacteroidota bacterium]|jgi:UDP-glucuronate 4-epimerase|nr:NAD-dependent epimerase [Algoriphagus sp.]
MNYLVTGAAGFIGYHVAKFLIQRGDQVIGLDVINEYYDPQLKRARLAQLGIAAGEIRPGTLITSTEYPDFRFVQANIVDKEFMLGLFEAQDFSVVIHLAAQAGVRYSLENPDVYLQSNLMGFLQLLECCRHFPVRHLVYASSSSVYGMNQKMPFSTSDEVNHPISLYASTKKANELMAHTYSHLFGIPTTGLRFFTVYGPWGRPDMAYFLFADAITKGEPIAVYNHGQMKRDFTYIDDVVLGLVAVADQPAQADPNFDPQLPDPSRSSAPFRIYNLGNSKPVALMDFIAALEKGLGKKAKLEYLPLQPGDVLETHADLSDLVRDVGYHPSVEVEQGVANFTSWYKHFYQI